MGGAGGFQIHELDSDYKPKISNKGIDIYSGPRGSLAGSLPAWIAWWSAECTEYQPGHIVYFPGVYTRDPLDSNAEVVKATSASLDGDLNSDRDQLNVNQSISFKRIRPGGSDLVGQDLSSVVNEQVDEGKREYFEYNERTLFVKIFGGDDDGNSGTYANDSDILNDGDFFNEDLRRKNGWFSFYELNKGLKNPTDAGSGELEIVFPSDNVSNTFSNGKWSIGPKVLGLWNTGFKEFPLGSTGASVAIEVGYNDVCLNMCDTFMHLAASRQSGSLDYVNFIKCSSVLRSPVVEGSDDLKHKTSGDTTIKGDYVEVGIQPTNKVSFGGNVLRSPKKQEYMLENELGVDEEVSSTVISAGYPALMSVNKALELNVGNDDVDFGAIFTEMDKDKIKVSESDIESEILSRFMKKSAPAIDPRYGEAFHSLNAYISSYYNFSMPVSSDILIKIWDSEQSYKVGDLVRHPINEIQKALGVDAELKDVLWKAKKDSTGEEPPIQAGNLPAPSESFEDGYWRMYTVLSNNPNTSLSQLTGLYKSMGLFSVQGLIQEEDASVVLSFSEKADYSGSYSQDRINNLSKDVTSVSRKPMSEIIGGSKLYAQLTVCPAKKYDIKTYRKETSRWYPLKRRRSGIGFRYPPLNPDAAMADLWLYPNNFRKDHAGQINFAVTFIQHTTFVWAQAKKRKISWWGILFPIVLCVVGVINPAIFLGCGALSSLYGVGTWAALGAAGAIGFAGGAAVGASAAVLMGRLRGVGSKKMFDRSSFNQIVGSLSEIQGGGNSLSVSRSRKSPEGSVMGNLSDENLYDTDSESDGELDIIRYNFADLYPYLYESKYNNTIHVSGIYQFYVQDLNSATIIKASINYEEISKRAGRSERDAFDKVFQGFPDGSREGNFAGANENIHENYKTYADKIVDSSGGSDSNLKLICERNYHNYLLLGPANLKDESDPYQALVVWSMDLSSWQFNSIIGQIQTGFRDLDLNAADDYSANLGLSEYQEYTTGNLESAADLEVADGYELNNEKTKIRKVGTNKYYSLPTNEDEVKALELDQAGVVTLSKGFKPGVFKLGNDISSATPDFVSGSKTKSQQWSDIDDGDLVDGGSVLLLDNDYYLAAKSFNKAGLSSFQGNTRRFGSSRSSVISPDAMSGVLTLVSQWKKIITSLEVGESITERGDSYGLTGRKLDFSFGIKENSDATLIPYFFLGLCDYAPGFEPLNRGEYQPGSVVSIDTFARGRDLNGVEPFDESVGALVVTHYYRLKEKIVDINASGCLPGVKSEADWKCFYWAEGEIGDIHMTESPFGSGLLDSGSILFSFSRDIDLIQEMLVLQPYIRLGDDENSPTDAYIKEIYNWKPVAGGRLDGNTEVITQAAYNNLPSTESSSPNDPSVAVASQTDYEQDSSIRFLTPYKDEATYDNQQTLIIPPALSPANTALVQNISNDDLDFNQTDLVNSGFAIGWLNACKDFNTNTSNQHISNSNINDLLMKDYEGLNMLSEWREQGQHLRRVLKKKRYFPGGVDAKVEKWEKDKLYKKGDVVFFEYSTDVWQPYQSGENSGRLWFSAVCISDESQGAFPPLYGDLGDVASVLSGGTAEFVKHVKPIDTKYWECITSRTLFTSIEVSSALGIGNFAPSFAGTDVSVRCYSLAQTDQEYTSLGGVERNKNETSNPSKLVSFYNTQREAKSFNVNRDFNFRLSTPADVELGVSIAEGSAIASFPQNVLKNTSNFPEQRISGKLASTVKSYESEGGSWPGQAGVPSSWVLTKQQWSNGYPKNDLISEFLQESFNSGARWSSWMSSIQDENVAQNNNRNVYDEVTFSLGNEYEKLEVAPFFACKVKDNPSGGLGLENFPTPSEAIAVRHRGSNINLYLSAGVANDIGEFEKPKESNPLYGYISVSINPSENKVIQGFDDTDGILFASQGQGAIDSSIKLNDADISSSLSSKYQDFLAGSDSSIVQFGPERLSQEIDLVSRGVEKSFSDSKIVVLKFPETSAANNPGSLLTLKDITTLCTSDGILTKNRTKIDQFVRGDNFPDYQFPNEDLIQQGTSWIHGGEINRPLIQHDWTSEVVQNKESTAYINSQVKSLGQVLDIMKNATTGDVDYFGESDSRNQVFDPDGVVGGFDPHALDYLVTITEWLGKKIGSIDGSDFTNTLSYVGGSSLTKTAVSSSKLYIVSQPSFLEDCHQNFVFKTENSISSQQRVDPENKIYFYAGSADSQTYGWMCRFPVNLMNKYVRPAADPSDPQIEVTHDYWSKLKVSLSAGGGETQDMFTAKRLYDPEVKFFKNDSLISSYEIDDLQGSVYDQELTVTANSFGSFSNGDLLSVEIDDKVLDDDDQELGIKRISATAKIVDPPKISNPENYIGGNLYHYNSELGWFPNGCRYKVYVNFPLGEQFTGKIIGRHIKSNGQYETVSQSQETTIDGNNYLEFFVPGSSLFSSAFSSRFEIVVDDGLLYGTGITRGSGFKENLQYPQKYSDGTNLPSLSSDPSYSTWLSKSWPILYIANPTLNISSLDNYNLSTDNFYVYRDKDIVYTGGVVGSGAAVDPTNGAVFVGNSSLLGHGNSNIDLSYSGGSATFSLVKENFNSEWNPVAGGRLNTGVITQAAYDNLPATESWSSDDPTVAVASQTDYERKTKLVFNDGTGIGMCGIMEIDVDTKFIDSPVIHSSSAVGGVFAGYKIYPNQALSILADSQVEVSFFSDSPFKSIVLKTSSTTITPSTETNDSATFSIGINDLASLESVELSDNILNGGGVTVTDSEINIDFLFASVPKKRLGDILVKANDKWVQVDGSPRYLSNRSDNSERLINSSGFNMTSSHYAKPRDMILMRDGSNGATSSNAEFGVKRSFSSDMDKDVQQRWGNDYVRWRSGSIGFDEPNMWLDVSAIVANHLWYNTCARGGNAIDISPGAMADYFFGASSTCKWVDGDNSALGADPVNQAAMESLIHKDFQHKTGTSTGPVRFLVKVNASGSLTSESFGVWEVLSSSNINDELSPSKSFNSGVSENSTFPLDGSINSSLNGQADWVQSLRLMGWRITSPHSFARRNTSSTSDNADNWTYSVNVIADDSEGWVNGNLAAKKLWESQESYTGRVSQGFIGIRNDGATRIKKIVTGVFPGVTYRLYFSAAIRSSTTEDVEPTINDSGHISGVNQYGPGGCRVYVTEPTQKVNGDKTLTKPLIAYGEFTWKSARSIDYNARNSQGGRGREINFCNNIPGMYNYEEGVNDTGDWADSNRLKERRLVGDEFRLCYVEFTPTLGANLVEICFENAFVAHLGSGGYGGSETYTAQPSNWTHVDPDLFFKYKGGSSSDTSYIDSHLKDWTEFKGPWVTCGFGALEDYYGIDTSSAPAEVKHPMNSAVRVLTGDNTFFISDTFIRATRPLWVEKYKIKKSDVAVTQGAYEINLVNGDSTHSPLDSCWLQSPTATGSIIAALIADNQMFPYGAIWARDEDCGWFRTSVDDDDVYECDVIRQHTHFYSWDPFAVCEWVNAPSVFWQDWIPTDPTQKTRVVPNLCAGSYIGRSCFWKGKIWRQKSSASSNNGLSRGPNGVRPSSFFGGGLSSGDAWSWADDFYKYAPDKTDSVFWEDITDSTYTELYEEIKDWAVLMITEMGSTEHESTQTATGDTVFTLTANGEKILTTSTFYGWGNNSGDFVRSGHVSDAVLCIPHREVSSIQSGSTAYQDPVLSPLDSAWRSSITSITDANGITNGAGEGWVNFRGLQLIILSNNWMYVMEGGNSIFNQVNIQNTNLSNVMHSVFTSSTNYSNHMKPSGLQPGDPTRKDLIHITSQFPLVTIQSFPSEATGTSSDFGSGSGFWGGAKPNVLIDPDSTKDLFGGGRACWLLDTEGEIDKIMGYWGSYGSGGYVFRSSACTGLKISSRGANYSDVLMPPRETYSSDLYHYAISPIIMKCFPDGYRNVALISARDTSQYKNNPDATFSEKKTNRSSTLSED